MKTYTYSYQNVKKPGRLRTAPAGAGKLAGYPKGPECTYHGRGVLHTPPKRARGPEWDVPGRAVGPVDHSPGRNPGRRNPGAAPGRID